MSLQLHLELLKEKIVQKYGHEITDHAECKELAQKISVETRKQLSASTIKRMFGLIKSNTNLSKHTLNVFAFYVGYKDWGNFLKINNFSSDHFWNKFNYLNEITSKVLLIEFDENAIIKDVNEVVEKLFGTKKTDLIGKKYSTIFNNSSINVFFVDLQQHKKHSRIVPNTINGKNNLLAEYFYPIFTDKNTLAKVFYLAFQIDKSELDVDINAIPAKVNEKWEHIQESAKIISNKNLQITKQISQLDYNKTLPREKISGFLEKFYTSAKIFSALVAPKGLGKSIALAHWIENSFFSIKAPHKNDVILYIDYHVISKQSKSIWQWLKSEIEYYSGLNISNTIFEQHSTLKYKIVIVIDSFIITTEQQADQFIDELSNFLFLNNRINCFKVIFSCRSYSWLAITKALGNITVIKELWYGVDFDLKRGNSINIPLLSTNEIKKIVDNHYNDINWNYLVVKYKSLLSLMKYPFFLDFFIKNYKNYSSFTDIFFYRNQIQQRILTRNFDQQKTSLIKKLIQELNWGKLKALPKYKTGNELDSFHRIYAELIENGVIYEYIETSDLSLNSEFITFNYEFLFHYLISCLWLDENEFNPSRIIYMILFYKDNQTGINILKKLSKSAALSDDKRKIEILFTSIWSQAVKTKDKVKRKLFQKYFISIFNDFSSRLVFSDIQQEKFLSLFLNSVLSKQHYFEFYFDIDILGRVSANNILHYISLRRTGEAVVIGKLVLLFKYYFENNQLNAKQIADEILLDKKIDNLYLKTLLACGELLMNQDNNIPGHICETINKFINYCQPESEFFVERAYINFWILETLTLKSFFKPIIENRNYFFQQEHTGLFIGKNMVKIYLANAYLQTNELHKAQIINKAILEDNLSEYEYFQNMRFYILQYHLQNENNELNRALEHKQKAVELAQRLSLDYFYLL